jgi:hypothetical protein
MSLTKLSVELGKWFSKPKPKYERLDRREYDQFRRLVKKLGTTYTVVEDGFVEIAPFENFPEGISTAHYNWTETLQRLENALEHPDLLKPGGYWTE